MKWLIAALRGGGKPRPYEDGYGRGSEVSGETLRGGDERRTDEDERHPDEDGAMSRR